MPRLERLPLLLLTGSFAASLLIGAPRAHAADTCLSGPQGATPAGRHWRYHIEAGTKRHCWYLGDAGGKTAQAPAKRPQTTAAASPNGSIAAPAAAPPPQPAAPLQLSVANAHAEMANTANVSDEAVASPPETPASSNAQDSALPSGASNATVPTRWPDPSVAVTQASPAPSPLSAAETPAATPKPDSQLLGERKEAGPAIPVVAAAALQAAPYSMPMLLGGLAGALAFAGLLGFGVIKFGSLHRIRRTEARQQETVWHEFDETPTVPWQPRDLDAEPRRTLAPQPQNNPPPRSRGEIEAASRDIMEILAKASREAAT